MYICIMRWNWTVHEFRLLHRSSHDPHTAFLSIWTTGHKLWGAKKICTQIMLYQTVIRPKIQNFTSKCCFLTWRRAQKNLTVTLKWAHTKFVQRFWSLHQGGIVFFDFVKLKMERNSRKCCFPLTRSKTVFPFWGLK